MIHTGEDPFRFWIHKESAYEPIVAIRFEADHGRAILAIPGREDPHATSHYEEENIPSDSLGKGRFVHVVPGGNRRSYSLSRLTVALIERLPQGTWVELEAITEFGFRYLMFPTTLTAKPKAAGVKAAGARPATPSKVNAPRPTPVSRAGAPARPAGEGAPRPPRQTPIAPELAHDALSGLSHQAAIQHLKMEMAKVEALQNHVDQLERKLASSQARERDLLGVLQKWQRM